LIAERRSRNVDFRLYLLGTVLVIGGCFGPWVPHKTAALTVTGYELAEFAKFFPEVQGGVISIHRPLFYLPFVAALLLVAVFAGRSAARSLRLAVPLCAVVVFVATLLPYSVVDGVRQALTARTAVALDPNVKGQLVLVIAGVVLAVVAPLARRLSRRAQGLMVALMALGGVVPALWQYALLRPLVVGLYDVPLAVGWGVIICVAGAVVLIFSGIRAAVSVG
jgi:hypothetical protein